MSAITIYVYGSKNKLVTVAEKLEKTFSAFEQDEPSIRQFGFDYLRYYVSLGKREWFEFEKDLTSLAKELNMFKWFGCNMWPDVGEAEFAYSEKGSDVISVVKTEGKYSVWAEELFSLIGKDGMTKLKDTLPRSVPKKYFYNKSELETIAEEQKKNELQLKYDAWMQEFGDYVTSKPSRTFNGKLFAVTGVEPMGHDKERDNPIVQKIISLGGQYRTGVSVKTDVLIVDPAWAGESKIKKVIEEWEKGHIIEVILLDQLNI